MKLKSKVELMTRETADWGWLNDSAINVMEGAAKAYGDIHGVDQDDLFQEAVLYVAARPARRRDDTGLRGAVRTVAVDMQNRLKAERRRVVAGVDTDGMPAG